MRGYDPSDGACDGDATLIECSSCGDPYDAAEYETCPVCWQGEGVPLRVDDVPTKRVRTRTDAELLAELEQHAEAGQ